MFCPGGPVCGNGVRLAPSMKRSRAMGLGSRLTALIGMPATTSSTCSTVRALWQCDDFSVGQPLADGISTGEALGTACANDGGSPGGNHRARKCFH